MPSDVDTLTFYKSRGRSLKQRYRWRYQAAGNSARLGNGGEGYSDQDQCVVSACRVVGLNPQDVYPHVDGSPLVMRCDGRPIQPIFS